METVEETAMDYMRKTIELLGLVNNRNNREAVRDIGRAFGFEHEQYERWNIDAEAFVTAFEKIENLRAENKEN